MIKILENKYREKHPKEVQNPQSKPEGAHYNCVSVDRGRKPLYGSRY